MLLPLAVLFLSFLFSSYIRTWIKELNKVYSERKKAFAEAPHEKTKTISKGFDKNSLIF